MTHAMDDDLGFGRTIENQVGIGINHDAPQTLLARHMSGVRVAATKG
jgi:hypothetical protein